ncbi:low molecular weight protein arginine phosphatase [Heliorestis acidaminivorans]|uniref:Low molecular weight protein arginine phosphatase n=1 Tax=Heliorestis acidaminivorans TaxID=553427 RepID=A0A6I0EZ75_9FIRM|nr:low molecular weight protein arginine phosphatase [Heliorestis acidaminivorans]KAB2953816.1 low molecular weight protein arginine phosphatase [Heliorestis acidaminivorans]
MSTQSQGQFTLLFVCTGNTCRSPMAQAIASTLLEEKGKSETIKVLSAGTFAWNNSPASLQARQVMLNQGLNIENHKATSITEEQLHKADLVLTMTENQKHLLLEMASDEVTKNKIFTFKEYSGDQGDVVDPFGQDEQVYYECSKELRAIIITALNKLPA